MRVTEETKRATRSKILEVAVGLFKSQGFEAVTTRDIAREAGIAVGTLFNYFPTKEAIVMQLMADALESAESVFERRRRQGAGLEEDIFLHISTGMRQLRALRTFLRPALDISLSPARNANADEPGEEVRASHLETVQRLASEHGMDEPLNGLHLQMYWLLYHGLLSFWAADSSPKQEDTYAMLDQTVQMYVNWLQQLDQ